MNRKNTIVQDPKEEAKKLGLSYPSLKKDYRVKNPTGTAKKMREAGEGMGKKRSTSELDKKRKEIGFASTTLGASDRPMKRSTSDGYMPSWKGKMMSGAERTPSQEKIMKKQGTVSAESKSVNRHEQKTKQRTAQ